MAIFHAKIETTTFMNADPHLEDKICTYKGNWGIARTGELRKNFSIKNLLDPFTDPASFCSGRLGNIESNAFFRITTHWISHSTPVDGVLLALCGTWRGNVTKLNRRYIFRHAWQANGQNVG